MKMSRERFAQHILRAAEKGLLEAAPHIPDATPEFVAKYRDAIQAAFWGMRSTVPVVVAQLDQHGVEIAGLEN
jgi:hypothetical protein